VIKLTSLVITHDYAEIPQQRSEYCAAERLCLTSEQAYHSMGEVEMTLRSRHAHRNGKSQTQARAYFCLGARRGWMSSLSTVATRSGMVASCAAANWM
jgi:hypothetical protein